MKKLIINRAKCLDCQDVIDSKFTHDFVTCGCYSPENRTGIFIDGGTESPRYGAYDWNKFESLSEYEGEDDPNHQILPGVVRKVGDEWILVQDGIFPKHGELVLIYDPSNKAAPYIVARYSRMKKNWKCAHCRTGKFNPKMWKHINLKEIV